MVCYQKNPACSLCAYWNYCHSIFVRGVIRYIIIDKKPVKLQFMNILLQILLSIPALVFSVISIIIAVRLHHLQQQWNFFTEYTRRYHEIMVHLYDNNNTHHTEYYRLYFDLCSEEYYLHKKNYLPQKVWKMWEDGMKLMAKHQSLETTWRDSRCLYNKQFIQFFEDIIKDSKSNKYNTL